MQLYSVEGSKSENINKIQPSTGENILVMNGPDVYNVRLDSQFIKEYSKNQLIKRNENAYSNKIKTNSGACRVT